MKIGRFRNPVRLSLSLKEENIMALLTKYNPLSELYSLNGWMEDEFSRFFPSRLEKGYEHWHPAVDILENEKEYIIKVELPEVDEKAIDMKIEKNTLTLEGERTMEHLKDKDSYKRVERDYGSFERSFRLPETVETEEVKAKLAQGVLNIRLPKKEETKPRNIKVEIK
jgi:HSP20 family protein